MAFLMVTNGCFDPKRDAAQIKQSNAALEYLTELALKIGSGLQMSSDAMAARIELSMKEQVTIMEGNCINLASVINRHGAICKKVIASPDDVYNDLLKE